MASRVTVGVAFHHCTRFATSSQDDKSQREPIAHGCFQVAQRGFVDVAQSANQFDCRNGADTLCIKGTGVKARRRMQHFETRVTNAGRAGNLRYHSALIIPIGHAQNDTRPDLGGQAQIDQPDLAAAYCG